MTARYKASAKRYSKALDELGWSQLDAARELHIDARTSRRYALGERKVPWVTQDWLDIKVEEELRAKKELFP